MLNASIIQRNQIIHPHSGQSGQIHPLEIESHQPHQIHPFNSESILDSANTTEGTIARRERTRNPLDLLIAIVAVIEACVIPIAQISSGSREHSAWLQLSAAAAEAEILRETFMSNTFELLRYYFLVLFFVENMEVLNGFGTPYGGDAFRNGNTLFSSNISDILKSAYPSPEEWSSPSADVYSWANSQQLNRIAEIAAADRHLAQAVAWQSEQVELGREMLAGVRAALTGALTILIGMIWAATVSGSQITNLILGRAATLYLKKVVWSALIPAGTIIIYLIAEGKQTQLKINSAIGHYKRAYKT